MTSRYARSSPYSNTPQFNKFVEYLGFYSPKEIPPSTSDIVISVGPGEANRPDLLSNKLYGTPDYWWIFPITNPDTVQDPIYDLVTG